MKEKRQNEVRAGLRARIALWECIGDEKPKPHNRVTSIPKNYSSKHQSYTTEIKSAIRQTSSSPFASDVPDRLEFHSPHICESEAAASINESNDELLPPLETVSKDREKLSDSQNSFEENVDVKQGTSSDDAPTALEYQTLRLELELREERVAALARQVDELSSVGQGDHEITQLRKAKHDLETKLKDQEEELDELAGQVQMLEAARTRLEMSHEQMRKEHKKEVQQREEEVEEVRIAAQKKVKALEAQVEAEHEERTQLVRDKHELERRLLELMDRSSVAPDDDTVHRLKKDLRKTKALLKDTQTMLEKSQSEGPSKLIIRQLKTQLEDCEFAKTAALKARQSADADLAEVQTALDDSQRSRKDAEDRASRFLKEKSELQTQLEENEELHAETLKKYKSTVSQISVDQITLSEQSQRIAELEQEKQLLSERLLELSSKVEVLEGETANIHTQRMLQMKVKELDSKLELELATKKRIESQVTRLKEQMERVSGECDLLKVKETQGVEQGRKLGRQLRQAKEESSLFEQRNTELNSKKQELEKQMEIMESEIATLKSDLKLAFKRIEDLQMALQGDISDSDSDLSDRGEDLMSPGSDAMAMIEEAREDQHSESFA